MDMTLVPIRYIVMHILEMNITFKLYINKLSGSHYRSYINSKGVR